MDQASEFVQQNSGTLGTVAFLAVLIAILYVVYTYLYPSDDPTFTQFLRGDADARKPVHIKGKMPAIYTGGDFTLSFWVYVDDWNYKASSYKSVLTIRPIMHDATSHYPLVIAMTPMRNSLMVRADTLPDTGASSAPLNPQGQQSTGDATPNINIESNFFNLLGGQTSMNMFQSTVDTPCDLKEIPLQRWVCVTIVSSGRVLDVYMDGKLTRSCVLDNVLAVPRGPLELVVGQAGGFGGRIASIQMWNQQLTPDVIYGVYQMGPSQASHNIFTDMAKWLNINVSFTGALPGGQRALHQIYSDVESAGARAYSDVESAGARAYSDAANLMSRF
jgi:hypothetical protein